MCAVELYWIPLGAGGWFVRRNGIVYERIQATLQRRRPAELFHAALIIDLAGHRHTIELCPEVPGDHGRVATGSVGSALAGRLRIFRYEARCWRDGEIPDLVHAVESPQVLSRSPEACEKLLALMHVLPTPVWGRDQLRTGEMWNSNSVVSWLLERSGIDASALTPPHAGRAPGWNAGVTLARRQSAAD